MTGFQPGSMMFSDSRYNSVNDYNMMGDGFGMMSGNMMMGGDMMGYRGGSLYNATPLSLEDAETAVADYLAGLENDDLTVAVHFLAAHLTNLST